MKNWLMALCKVAQKRTALSPRTCKALDPGQIEGIVPLLIEGQLIDRLGIGVAVHRLKRQNPQDAVYSSFEGRPKSARNQGAIWSTGNSARIFWRNSPAQDFCNSLRRLGPKCSQGSSKRPCRGSLRLIMTSRLTL